MLTYSDDSYTRYTLADSCYAEVYHYYPLFETEKQSRAADSTLVVTTVCAPICSSCARVYNKEGELIRQELGATLFSQASIVDGELIWTDQTPLLLDDSEQ